jgi:HPt (histidine-containing phosphotransfer) domain-containing protein
MKPFKAEDLLTVITTDIAIDFSSLKKMTLNDPVLLEHIIQGFGQDCLDDQDAVERALSIKDWDQVTLIIHRLAGRTGQMGITELANSFREAEQKLRQDNFNEQDMLNHIGAMFRDLNLVIKEFRKEKSYSIS